MGGALCAHLDLGPRRAERRGSDRDEQRTELVEHDGLGVFQRGHGMRARGSREFDLERAGELRRIAAALKANDGMLDVAEVRVRLQRGDQAEFVRLLEHMRREHGRDPQVLQAFAEVLAEAGIDLSALAAAGGGAPRAAPAVTGTAAPEAGGIWTPGGSARQDPPSGEKKVIWTPG